MAETRAPDFLFTPKVWSDHIQAYFSRKLAFGAFAMRNDTLTRQRGETIHFPFFKAIGAAEEPLETADLTVDNLEDDSFNATVKEVAKAVGFTDKSLRVSAAELNQIFGEAQNQIAQVLAEKVDSDIITEINTGSNHTVGFTAAAAADVCTLGNLFTAKTIAFGDRASEASVIFMHSLHHLSMIKDSNSGFLKADANDPMYRVPGFEGRLFGAAVVVNDNVPQGADVGGKKSYYAYICKPNAYGIMLAQEPKFEKDRDILARITYITATHWYAVKAFHGKVAASDKRICRALFATEVNA